MSQLRPFLERKTGLATVVLVSGIIEMSILVTVAYRESLESLPLYTVLYTDSYGFDPAIHDFVVVCIIGIAALTGYVLNDVRRGLGAFWLSQMFTFLVTPIVMQFAWSPNVQSTSELLRSSLTFQALHPSILFHSISAVGTILILLFYVGMGGMASVFIGSFYREPKFARGRILINRWLIIASLLMDGVAVLIPLVPPAGTNFTLIPADWALPITGSLLGLGTLLTVVAVTRHSVTSSEWSGLLTIGSVTAMVCAIVSITFATFARGSTFADCISLGRCQEYQYFSNLNLLLYASIPAPFIVFLATTFFTRKPTTMDSGEKKP